MRDFDRGFLLGLYTALKILEENSREEASTRIKTIIKRMMDERVEKILAYTEDSG